ncbi:hypothetical protein [Sphingomonas profundi]|uniref:hypothetical protein n=1 Tax=Alterirhizorhabdus profundi TaxID=2681549 RepID=UPI0012E84F7A|nr:hypothetical protein [Sphingomonas profundi]
MADQQPNNAPEEIVDRTEVGEPAAALQDLAGEVAGGGGLGGASAAAAAPHTTTGTTRNSPIDVPVPHEGAEAQTEAVARAADEAAVPDHPSSL